MPKVSNETSVVPSDAQVTNDGGSGKKNNFKLIRLCGLQLAESNIRSVLEWTTIVIVIVDC